MSRKSCVPPDVVEIVSPGTHSFSGAFLSLVDSRYTSSRRSWVGTAIGVEPWADLPAGCHSDALEVRAGADAVHTSEVPVAHVREFAGALVAPRGPSCMPGLMDKAKRLLRGVMV